MNGNEINILKEIHADVKELLRFQATTEQRLKTGSEKFGDHESRVRKLESRECPIYKGPRGWIVYGMITIGFVILGLLKYAST